MEIKNKKNGLLSNHLFQKAQEYGGWRDFKLSLNFYKKQCLPVMTWNKEAFIEANCNNNIQTGKTFFASAMFEDLEAAYF